MGSINACVRRIQELESQLAVAHKETEKQRIKAFRMESASYGHAFILPMQTNGRTGPDSYTQVPVRAMRDLVNERDKWKSEALRWRTIYGLEDEPDA